MKHSAYADKSSTWYLFYSLLHPSDAFQEMKYNRKFSGLQTVLIVVLWMLTELCAIELTDFDLNAYVGQEKSLLRVAVITALTFLIAVIANWCFCTLLDGKGRLLHIASVGASALVPYIAVRICEILLSYITNSGAATFFQYAVTVAVIWGFIIVFLGLQAVHEYSAGMTLLSLALTVVGIVIIIFVGLIVVQLYQQIVVFISTIVLELQYR